VFQRYGKVMDSAVHDGMLEFIIESKRWGKEETLEMVLEMATTCVTSK
jgi:hypothetical protein